MCNAFSLLCSPELDSIMKHVLVWNNNPEPNVLCAMPHFVLIVLFLTAYLSQLKDFISNSCSEEKLQIVNSTENLYFRERFLGCSQSDAGYSFIPVIYSPPALALLIEYSRTTAIEVVQMLHARIMEHEQPSDVSLLPPYERLSGDPHEVYTHNRTLRTSFSWLGHAPFSGIRISFVIASFEISRGRIEDGK
jgi:hypothetical protein